jgi:hypothetical protein
LPIVRIEGEHQRIFSSPSIKTTQTSNLVR